MQSKGGAGGNWEVVNGCPYKVVGKFCYEGDRGILSCQKKGGGFGPLSAGGREMVTPPENQGAVRWRVENCKYDDWVKGSCRM